MLTTRELKFKNLIRKGNTYAYDFLNDRTSKILTSYFKPKMPLIINRFNITIWHTIKKIQPGRLLALISRHILLSKRLKCSSYNLWTTANIIIIEHITKDVAKGNIHKVTTGKPIMEKNLTRWVLFSFWYHYVFHQGLFKFLMKKGPWENSNTSSTVLPQLFL